MHAAYTLFSLHGVLNFIFTTLHVLNFNARRKHEVFYACSILRPEDDCIAIDELGQREHREFTAVAAVGDEDAVRAAAARAEERQARCPLYSSP